MNDKSSWISPSCFGRDPRWKPYRQYRISGIPQRYVPWLTDRSSLTQRLIQHCSGRFRVQLLRQGWRRPMCNEALRLQIPCESYALVREVHLLCNDIPWVYARTVIPHSSLTGRERRLAHLHNRSLGAVLFSDPSMRRDELEVSRICHNDRLFGSIIMDLDFPDEEVWGRRSVFYLSNKPLLVSEIFLPDIVDR